MCWSQSTRYKAFVCECRYFLINNSEILGAVDGCITVDGDSFLYGMVVILTHHSCHSYSVKICVHLFN